MSRLTDNDKKFLIFTYAKATWKRTSIVLCSNGDDDDESEILRNSVVMYLFGWIVRFYIPAIIKPYREFVDTSIYDWSKNGGYWQSHRREYGFSLSEGFLQLYLGAQTHDSSTTKSWCKHLPWTQWRHVRCTVYDKNLNIRFEEKYGDKNKFGEKYEIVEKMDKAIFQFKDFDGDLITAHVHVEQRQWKFGDGWFKWLSIFRKDMLRTNIEINLDKEIGREKGSWKGGTVGLGFDMEKNESIKNAFIRWCNTEQRSKSGRFKVSYVGEV